MSDWQPIETAKLNDRIDVKCADGSGDPYVFHDVLFVDSEAPYAFADVIHGRLKIHRPHEDGMWVTHWRPSTSPEAQLPSPPVQER